jgi:hypothetical protein
VAEFVKAVTKTVAEDALKKMSAAMRNVSEEVRDLQHHIFLNLHGKDLPEGGLSVVGTFTKDMLSALRKVNGGQDLDPATQKYVQRLSEAHANKEPVTTQANALLGILKGLTDAHYKKCLDLSRKASMSKVPYEDVVSALAEGSMLSGAFDKVHRGLGAASGFVRIKFAWSGPKPTVPAGVVLSGTAADEDGQQIDLTDALSTGRHTDHDGQHYVELMNDVSGTKELVRIIWESFAGQKVNKDGTTESIFPHKIPKGMPPAVQGVSTHNVENLIGQLGVMLHRKDLDDDGKEIFLWDFPGKAGGILASLQSQVNKISKNGELYHDGVKDLVGSVMKGSNAGSTGWDSRSRNNLLHALSHLVVDVHGAIVDNQKDYGYAQTSRGTMHENSTLPTRVRPGAGPMDKMDVESGLEILHTLEGALKMMLATVWEDHPALKFEHGKFRKPSLG